jgi:hypothetical protein
VSIAAQARAATQPAVRPYSLCTRWLLILLLQGLTNDAIRLAVARDDLPCPTNEILDALRGAYMPKKLRVTSTRGKALIEELGLTPFFTSAPEVDQVLVLLHRPKARELLEAGLIVGAPLKAIQHALSTYVHLKVTTSAIQLYRLVLFDVATLSRAALRVAVRARVRIAVLAVVADPADEATARRAIRADARSVAMTMPSSSLSWVAVLMAMGHSVSKIELPRVVVEMENLAALRVGESLLRGGPDDERRASGYATVLERIRAIKLAVIPPEATLVKHLAGLRLHTNTEKTPSMAELCGTNHTVDMGPPLEAPADEVDGGGDVENEGASAR